ncbi:MAG TPA: DMT family transporter [Planctomycetota bacterium]
MLLLQASPSPFAGAGELCAVGNLLAWGTASVLFRRAFRTHRPADATLFKNVVSLAVLAALAVALGPARGGGASGAGDWSWLLVSGALAVGVGDFLYFVALVHIGVARTQVLVLSAPVLTALLAVPILGERMTALQWTGAFLVVGAGVLVESRRSQRVRADTLGVLAALGAVLAYASGTLATHWGLDDTGAFTASAWRLAGGVVAVLLLQAANGRLLPAAAALLRRDNWRAFLLPTLIGTVVGMGLLSASLKWTRQGVAMGIGGALPLVSIPLARWWLGERPGLRGWGGAALAGVGVALLASAAAG